MCRRSDFKKKKPKVSDALSVALLVLFLFSCSSKKEKVPEDGEVKINLIADKDINPNAQGHPAPLNIFIYSVRDTDVFRNADFFEIIDGSNKSFASSSSRIYEAILKPGEERAVYLAPQNKMLALGVVGAYRDLNDSSWRKIYEMPQPVSSWWTRTFSNEKNEFNVNFRKSVITIKRMD